MKIGLITIVFLTLIGISFRTIEEEANSDGKIKIEWTENLEGDFSFKNEWRYPEGIYKNQHGQLSCDGICPPEIDGMKDASGKIYDDSLEAFYNIVDTAHMALSLKSENRMYEYSGTDFMEFTKQKDGTIRGFSLMNVSTHSALIIEIQHDHCSVWVDFNSITDLGEHTFPLENGSIKMDQSLFEKGIIKATFDFTFENTLNPNEKLFWKGQIYSRIKDKETKSFNDGYK